MRSRVDRKSILVENIQYQSVERCIHANIEYLRSYLRLRIGRLSHWRELRYDKYRCARKHVETRTISSTNSVRAYSFSGNRPRCQSVFGYQLRIRKWNPTSSDISRSGRPFFSYIFLEYIWLINCSLIWWSSISIWLTKTLSPTRLKDSFSVYFIGVS